MKRLIAAAILLVFVVSVYLIGTNNVKRVYTKAEVLLSECDNTFANKENASKNVKELEDYWGKSEKLLSVFSNHSRIDEIELAIHLLNVHSKTKDATMYYEYSGRVKTLLHQLKEDTVPSVHSIL